MTHGIPAVARRRLRVLPGNFAVCRLEPNQPPPAWVFHGGAGLYSLTHTGDELSVVCPEGDVPPSVTKVEPGWRALALTGPVPFAEVGVLASLVTPLAAAQIPVFAISTYDTDLLMLKQAHLARALEALAGRFDIAGG